MENFKDIPGYEGLYAADSDGNIWSYYHKKILKLANSHHKYKRIQLYKNGEFKTFAVHRIVASLFVENPYSYNEINHKNEDASDNRAENLEWCTRKYNVNYGNRIKNLSKKIVALDKNNNVISEYPSQAYASRVTGISQGSISNACSGRSHTAGGYKWKYYESE